MFLQEEVVTDWSPGDAIIVWGGRVRLALFEVIGGKLSDSKFMKDCDFSKVLRWCIRCTHPPHVHGQWVAFLVCWQWQQWLWQWECRLDWTMVLSSPATKVQLMTETSRVIIIIMTESGWDAAWGPRRSWGEYDYKTDRTIVLNKQGFGYNLTWSEEIA